MEPCAVVKRLAVMSSDLRNGLRMVPYHVFRYMPFTRCTFGLAVAVVTLMACGRPENDRGALVDATQSAGLPSTSGQPPVVVPPTRPTPGPTHSPTSFPATQPSPTVPVFPTVPRIEQFAALPDYGVTTRHFDRVENADAKDRFLDAYSAGRPGRWEMVHYTIEGDPVSLHVVYAGHETQVRLLRDATKDRFAGHRKRSAYLCTALVEGQGQLSATGCTASHRLGKMLTYPIDWDPAVSLPTPTPEPTATPLVTVDAAIASVMEMHDLLPASSPDIRVTIPVSGGIALLMTYYAQPDDQPLAVTEFLYLDRRAMSWYPDGNAHDFRPAGDPPPPIQFLYGSYVIGNERDRCTFAGGLVTDPRVREVRVTFSDGSRQEIGVERGAYLAVQLGVERVNRVEAMDDKGRVLHHQEMP